MIQLWNDSITMTGRNILRLRRNPQVIFFTLIQPVFFVLIFTFVFGGSIETNTSNYANFLIPGVLTQTLAFAGSNTALVLAQDSTEGSTDRFLSLPIKRTSVLIGRTLADTTRFVLISLVLAVVFGFTFSWIYVTLGLLIKNTEAVQSASFVPTLLVTFASSAFAPVESMPAWLQVFAKRQPVTHAVDAIRGLTEPDLAVARPMMWAALWIVGILAIFVPFSTWLFSRN